MLHPRSFAPVHSLTPKRKGKKEATPRGSCFCWSKYPGAGLVVLIGDSGAWYNVGNIRQRMELKNWRISSRHTKMIVINGGVPFRVVSNLVTFCILSSFNKNKGVSQTPYQSSVMTLHAVVKGVSKRGQKEKKRAKLLLHKRWRPA